jgi:chaperonin GroEL
MSTLFQVSKPKSAAKIMLAPGPELDRKVLETLSHIAKMVGTTLGPGGKQVLLERPEMNMKPIMTKDGVTVIKHLGYEDATRQLILETVRDAAIRTAAEAGDGTTTAVILSDSIACAAAESVRNNNKISPQKIVREMQGLVPLILQKIDQYKLHVNNDENILLKVATLSANGDKELANTIIEAFNAVGDEGNITIVELPGPSRYEVKRIHGYTVERGYEESTKALSNGFINDKTGSMVVLDNPIFILFDGIITDVSQILDPLNRLGQFFVESKRHDRGVVLVAHSFSDQILGDFHVNWNASDSTVKVYPLVSPQKAIMNWRTNFLYDLQAYTGCPVFNPIEKPLAHLNPSELATSNKVTYFECNRFRSSVVAKEDFASIELRVEELRQQRLNPESEYEKNDLDVRIGQLTSGIARLNIYGPSQGETREKRDRAEDAWMSIRGAIRHGAIPGGGYALVRLAADFMVLGTQTQNLPQRLAVNILAEALLKPVKVLYTNYGYNKEETDKQLTDLLRRDQETFDISEQKWAPKDAILDSVPAVAEAIQNSISIASLLGTVGGIVAFKRDHESDKAEEKFIRNFETSIGERS